MSVSSANPRGGLPIWPMHPPTFPLGWEHDPSKVLEDPGALLRYLKDIQAALDNTAQTIESLTAQFSLSSPKLLQSVHMSDTADSVLNLTTSNQDVPGIEITAPMDGWYLLLYVFDFVIDGPGDSPGQLTGVAKVGVNELANWAIFRVPTPTEDYVATISNFHVAFADKGETMVLRAKKQIDAGLAQVSNVNTRLSVLGPL